VSALRAFGTNRGWTSMAGVADIYGGVKAGCCMQRGRGIRDSVSSSERGADCGRSVVNAHPDASPPSTAPLDPVALRVGQKIGVGLLGSRLQTREVLDLVWTDSHERHGLPIGGHS
jgi:hypothetical protein